MATDYRLSEWRRLERRAWVLLWVAWGLCAYGWLLLAAEEFLLGFVQLATSIFAGSQAIKSIAQSNYWRGHRDGAKFIEDGLTDDWWKKCDQ
jgi:hypothetical protein